MISGFAGGGLYSIIPGYISEISDDDVRGSLGSTLVFACNLGLFCSYVFGAYIEYLTIPWLMVPITLVFVVFFVRVPDSPAFLAKKNLSQVSIINTSRLKQLGDFFLIEQEAESSLLYFKNIRKYSKCPMDGIKDDLLNLQFDSDDDVAKLSFSEKNIFESLMDFPVTYNFFFI